jgi:protein-tyrosine phosphatase
VSRWFRSYGFADVYDDLIVGAYPLDQDDVDALARLGIRRVLNLTEDEEYPPGDREQVARALAGAGIAESRLPLTDYGGLPAGDLEAAVRAVGSWLDEGERTYIHCRAGWQRSAAIAAGVVAARTGMDVDDAVDYVRRRKPSADPLPHQRADLRRWWEDRREAERRGGAPEEATDEPIRGDPEPDSAA